MSRLVACYSVLNEGDFLEYSIRSVLPHVDKLIIVEGAYQNHKAANKGKAHSIDNTWKIVGKYMKHKKVTALRVSEPTQQKQRGRYLDYLKDGDIMLMVDGDELYCPQDLKWIRRVFNKKQHLHWLRIKHIAFVHDFAHHWTGYPYYRKGRVSAYRYRKDWEYYSKNKGYDAIHLWTNGGKGRMVCQAFSGMLAPAHKCLTMHARYLKPKELLAIKNAYYHINDPQAKNKIKGSPQEIVQTLLEKQEVHSKNAHPWLGRLPKVLKDHKLAEAYFQEKERRKYDK